MDLDENNIWTQKVIGGGFTMVPHAFLERMSNKEKRLSGDEWLVLNFIMRKTWGYQKRVDRIALELFVEATKLPKPNVCRAIRNLIKDGIISKYDGGKNSIYRVNFDIRGEEALSKTITPEVKSVVKNDNGIIKPDSHPLSKSTPIIDNKDTSQKISDDYENMVLRQREKDLPKARALVAFMKEKCAQQLD